MVRKTPGKADPAVLIGREVFQDIVYTAGGLTSGIDFALHIVQKYYGHAIALQTAKYMEYESTHWIE